MCFILNLGTFFCYTLYLLDSYKDLEVHVFKYQVKIIIKYGVVFSMVAIRFPEDNATVFGACESAIGMGMMIGPILGQVFYYFEFEGCFYGTGVLILLCGFISHCFMPDSLNKNDEKPAIQNNAPFSLNSESNSTDVSEKSK